MCPKFKWIYFMAIMLAGAPLTKAQKQQKRQIYREQLLPALGGKIPEEAFRTDRLALNRLNKEGITVIDGVLLQARDHEKNPDPVRSKPEIIQVYVTQDPRYVPSEGRYRNDRPKSVDTTYVIRKPIGVDVGHRTDFHQRERLNGLTSSHLPISQPHQNANSFMKVSRNYPHSSKAHGYANYHRFVTKDPSLIQQRSPNHHQTIIYKPIVTPLVIPSSRRPIQTQTNNKGFNARPPSWQIANEWVPFYQRSPFFLDSGDLFLDSHEIFTNYEDFFNNFHGRSYRHIGGTTSKTRGRVSSASNESPASSENSSIAYTKLTSVPETSFSCAGRTGTYADIETKCQVFHECSGWSKTSSLCPVGTAYSTTKKRCEWWDTVTCGSA